MSRKLVISAVSLLLLLVPLLSPSSVLSFPLPPTHNPTFSITDDVVTDSWHTVSFAEDFAAAPVVVTSMQSFDGGDTAGVRMRDLTKDGMQIKIEEEKSGDTEVAHTTEQVGFAAFDDGRITNKEGQIIGEANTTQASQTDNNEWHTVTLQRQYVNPVVIMQLATFNGSNPSHIRMKDVTSTSFKFQIEEWDYLDQYHTTETMTYIVMEEGTWSLPGDIEVEVGTIVSDDGWVGLETFEPTFSPWPMVVSRSQTYNGGQAAVTRQRVEGIPNSGGFEIQLRVQEEEGNDGRHAEETVGYFRFSADHSVTHGRTGDVVTHDLQPIIFDAKFRPSIDDAVLCSIQTFDGGDPAGLRVEKGFPGMWVMIEEEQSGDSEMNHTTEDVGYAAFHTGAIQDSGGQVIGEAGNVTTDQANTTQWHTVTLQNTYTNPVVMMQLASSNGSDPSHVRVKNVQSSSFEFQLEEWDYLNGAHLEEEFSYVVIEEGSWEFSSGIGIVAGTVEAGDDWAVIDRIDLMSNSVPTVLTMSQTRNGGQAVVTRQRVVPVPDTSAVDLQVRMQEEEGNDGTHVVETVGYLLLD